MPTDGTVETIEAAQSPRAPSTQSEIKQGFLDRWVNGKKPQEVLQAERSAEVQLAKDIAEAKGYQQIDKMNLLHDAKLSQMEKGAAARVAEMEAKQASGLFGRFNFLKGYHGGSNMKAGGQVAAEALAPAGKMTGKVMKWGAIAAVAAGGLAAVGMTVSYTHLTLPTKRIV